MNDRRVASFGSWDSPIDPDAILSFGTRIGEVVADGDVIWFALPRPEQGGRVAIMAVADGEAVEKSPPGANVRSRVHEYGGAAWWVHDGELWWVEAEDQRLRRWNCGDPAAAPVVLTAASDPVGSHRYADGRPDRNSEWYVCVREVHHDAGSVTNDLVAIAADGSEQISVLATGADFYSTPRLNPGGTQLAWVQWDHPNMPWDRTELWLGDYADGKVTNPRCLVASDTSSVAPQQPMWGPDGSLYVVADFDDWWNLYRWEAETVTSATRQDRPEPVVQGAFEIGTPPWVFGRPRVAIAPDRLYYAATSEGTDELVALGPAGTDELVALGPAGTDELVALGPTGTDELVALGSDNTHGAAGHRDRLTQFLSISSLTATADGSVVFVATTPGSTGTIMKWNPDVGTDPTPVWSGPELPFDRRYFPAPEPISFATTGDAIAHALWYPPASAEFCGEPSERPPLLVRAHGGPTSDSPRDARVDLRYWTSRGIGVVDVLYRGSTGYGRPYREALLGQWGVVDVDDCIAAAEFLAQRGDVDPSRIAIAGSSAGGFTVLAALQRSDAFSAGAIRYGVADLRALVADTHKFEARYTDSLIAPWPQGEAVYEERSPVNHLDRLDCPLLVLQGAQDRVVPPSQAQTLVDGLDDRGVPWAYHVFADEAHGFRSAEAIVAAMEMEFAFFATVWGFQGADELEPPTIHHFAP